MKQSALKAFDPFRVVAIAAVVFVAVDVVLYMTGPYRGGSISPLLILVVVELLFYAGFALYVRWTRNQSNGQ